MRVRCTTASCNHRPLTREWIGEGSAAWVDDRRKSKFDAAAPDDGFLALEVDLVVMSGAQQPNVQRLAVAAQHHLDDLAVASQAAGVARR
jgi:hypothetical protein